MNKLKCNCGEEFYDNDCFAAHWRKCKPNESNFNHGEEDMAINIIVADDDNVSPSQIFVEIENDAGESIRIGAELTTDEGYRKIRISTSDIINHEKI